MATACGTAGTLTRRFGLDGTRWGGIEQWREGFICRGVLLDVPRHRGEPYVTQERPVHGSELVEIAAAPA